MKMWALIPMLAVLTIAARAADNLEQIEAAMKKNWESLKSVSMDSEMVMDQSTPQFSFKNVSSGTTEMLKDGAKWKMRSETKGTMTQKFGDQETKTASSTTVVSDGEYIYSLTDSNGMKQAFKMKVQPGQEYAGDSWMKSMRDIYNLKVLPDEAVDGANCWVLEATPKQATGQGVSIFYFTKDSGMMVKSITKGPDGKVLSTMTSKNIKINPSIAADRFVFTAPAGVTVIDQTAALQAAQQQQTQTTTAQEQPEPAKKEEPAKTEPAKSEEPAKKEEPKKEEKKKEKKIKVPGF